MADLRNQIRALGNVNVSAIEEYQEVRERYDALSAQVADVEGEQERADADDRQPVRPR